MSRQTSSVLSLAIRVLLIRLSNTVTKRLTLIRLRHELYAYELEELPETALAPFKMFCLLDFSSFFSFD